MTKTKPTKEDPNSHLYDIPEQAMSFDKFMQETLRKENTKPKVDGKNNESNPNKLYVQKYYERIAGNMWIGKPRYR